MPSAARAQIFELPGQFIVGQTGSAVYSLPIAVPPGTAGMVPSLSLNYSSSAGNGIVGIGWSLGGLPSITRCARTVAQDGVHGGVNLDANDRFCLNGQRLMLISGTYGAAGAVYGTEIEGFSQIISYGSAGTGPLYFTVQTKSGQTMQFGYTSDSRVIAYGTTTALSWSLNQVTDAKGNYYSVTYSQDTANSAAYPSTISYTGNASTSPVLSPYNSVSFTYTTAPTPQLSYVAGSQVQIVKRLSQIQTLNQGAVVNTYTLGYTQSGSVNNSELTSVQRCDGSGNCMPATTFGWQGSRDTLTVTATAQSFTHGKPIIAGDYNGDGLTDILVGPATGTPTCGVTSTVYLGNQSNSFTASSMTFTTPTYSGAASSSCTVSSADFNGDGFSDLLGQNFELTYSGYVPEVTYYNNNYINTKSLSFGSIQTIGTSTKSFSPSIPVDFNGDGLADVFIQQPSVVGPSYIGLSNSAGAITLGSGLSGYDLLSVSLYFGDFDGDGCTDILAQGGTNTLTYYKCNSTPASVGVTNWTATSGNSLVLGDFNGDGKTDVLVVGTSGSTLYLSTGTGFATGIAIPSSSTWANGTYYTIVTGDFNGDGKTDIALISKVSGTPHAIFLSTGTGFVEETTIATTTGDPNTTATVGDWNNDGASDLWVQQSAGDTEYALSFTPELMTSVTTGHGAVTTITYDRLNHGTIYTESGTTPAYPTQNVNGPSYVVSYLASSNGVGGTYNSTYSYSGAQRDLSGRGSLGFAQRVVTDPQTSIVQTTNYSQTFPTIGQITSQTSVRSGVTLSQINNTVTSTSLVGGRYFPYVSPSVQYGADLDGSAVPTVTTTYSYDSYGNATSIIASSSDGFTNTTSNTYTNNTSSWYIGQLTATSVTAAESGASSITRSTSYSYDSTNGLTGQAIMPGTAYELDTVYTLDAYGNQTNTQVSGSGIVTRTSAVSYDAYHRFPASITNALGQIETRSYDSRFGGITGKTDPNGLTTSASYDGFGRQVSQTQADGTTTSWAYTASANPSINSTIVVTPTASPAVTQYYDTLERQLYTTHVGFDNATTIYDKQVSYDSYGRVQYAYLPYFASGAAYATTYTYDALNRPLTVTAPDSSVTSYAYHGLSSTVRDNLSHPTTTVKNSQGKAVSVTDALGNVTYYAYDAFGDLTSATDPAGNVSRMVYDAKGRMTSKADPDRGTWYYSYDVLDERTGKTDANGNSTTIGYDLLGRMTSRSEADLYSTWTYDTQAYGVGKLASTATTAGFTRTQTYDSLGRPLQTTDTIGGTNYVTTKSYDSYSRVTSVLYPSGWTAGYSYSASGYLGSITNGVGGAALWTANARDALSNLTQETAGNGIVTSLTYDPHVERLTAISAGSGGGVQLDGYVWDTLGNLSERVDYNNYVTETFGYDALNRITAANISGGVSKSYAYDATGNLTSKSDVGTYSYPAAGSARPHGVTAIAGSVDNGTGASGVISNPTYSYDANGNLTSGGGRSLTYASFNVPTSITSGSSTLSFTFDSYHKRITQTTPEGSTVYLNGGGIQSEKYTNASTGVVYWRHYIAADGAIKAIYTQTANTSAPQWGSVTWNAFNWTSAVASSSIYYLHQDHLGSVVAISSTSGAVIERDAYDPWGKRRNTSGADDTNDTMTGSYITPGYTGQEELQDVALLHLNARLYDPQIGRFYGSDPIVSNPYSTQGWNRFAYVGNNPLLYTDPTGRAQICYYQPNFATSYFDPIDGEVLDLSETQVCIDLGEDLIPPNISIPDITTPNPSQDAQQKQEIVVYGQKKTLPAYDPLSQAITDIAYNLFNSSGGGQGPQSDPCSSPGDSFSSEQAAATAAIRTYNPESISQNKEFAGRIYQDHFDSSYSFTAPNIGTIDSSDPGLCLFHNCGGMYHTHGGPNPGYLNQQYSTADFNAADQLGQNSYLGTPNGDIRVYTPGTDTRASNGRLIGTGANQTCTTTK